MEFVGELPDLEGGLDGLAPYRKLVHSLHNLTP